MLLPAVIVRFEDVHPRATTPSPQSVTLAGEVQHAHPIAATADHPRHVAYYGVALFIVLLLVLAIMGSPVLRWRRREGEIRSRPTST